MARPTTRKRERLRLREIRRDLRNVSTWTPEYRARIEEELRQLMLLGFDAENDHPDFRLSMAAVTLFIEIEGEAQEAELRAEWLKGVSVTVRTYDPATGATISERVLRPATADVPGRQLAEGLGDDGSRASLRAK